MATLKFPTRMFRCTIWFATSLFAYDINSRPSLSRSPGDFPIYFEISVLRHIRFAELRKKQKTNPEQSHFTTGYVMWLIKLRDNLENIVEKRRNCSLGAISPLFYNILLPVVRFSCSIGIRFSLRNKRLFEISEVEITRVDCRQL